MKQLNDTNFDQWLQEHSDTVIVKFYADWCPDCRRIESAYEGFPNKYADAAFAEVNTEESPELAQRFEVRGIPSFMVFRQGQLIDRLYSRDAKSVSQVEQFVTTHTSAKV